MQPWVTVFNGPVWRVQFLRSRLEEAGIPAFVPNQNSRTMDPFITGGDAFSLDVMVPENSVAAARQLLAEAEVVTSPRGEGHDADDSDGDDAELAMAARRLRWLTLLVATAPIALVMGILYLRAVRRTGIRPREHAFTLVAIGVAAVFTLVAVGGVLEAFVLT